MDLASAGRFQARALLTAFVVLILICAGPAAAANAPAHNETTTNVHAANSSDDIQIAYSSAVSIGDSSLDPRANAMALDVAVSGGSIGFGGNESAVVRIRQPSTGASLTVTPDTSTRYNVTDFDTQNLYDADGSLKSPTNDKLSITGDEAGFTQINVTVSGDRDIFNRSTFGQYVVEVRTAQGTLIADTEPGLRAIGYPGKLSQNATEGTIAVTFPRLSTVNSSWDIEYRVDGADGRTVISESLANSDGQDNFSATFSSGQLSEGTYNHELIIKQNETDPVSQRILRAYGIFDDALEITDGQTNDSDQSTASVTFNDATVTNGTNTVTIDSATLSEGGFVVIHSKPVTGDNITAVDSVIGASTYLSAGTTEDITITLDQEITSNTTLVAMAHQDTNGNAEYDFVTSGGQADGSYTEDDAAVTDDANITVTTQSAGLPAEPSFFEVIDIITAYNNDEPYNGVEVGFGDVIDAISAYNEGR